MVDFRRSLSRRLFTAGGAGLLLSPFLNLRAPANAQAGAKRAKRLLLFCTMGTNPDSWTPRNVVSENNFAFSPCTMPLAAIKQHIVMVEGLPSGNPGNNHGSPDGLSGQGFGGNVLSLDQFVADRLQSAGVRRPIPALLLGSEAMTSGGRTMFNRGNNLPTIASPMSAFTTVFGGATTSGMSPDLLLRRRKSIVDLIKGEVAELSQIVGTEQRARLQLHLDSIRQIENRLTEASMPSAPIVCNNPARPTAEKGLPADLAHIDIILGAFACDITRVAAIQFGSDQSLPVNLPEIGLQGDQHGGFLHSGGPDFKNLIALEQWFSQRFVDIVNRLKATPEADGSGTLFDNTLIVWARDMGDAVTHNQKSMRFVLSGGAGGYLKTDPNGRYLRFAGTGPGERHERVLLSACEAMGITSFAGFGDPKLVGADKTPLPGLSTI